ncbi:DUF2283 domain-containing protein [Synechococcus sp. BDU 130192]|uniref:DUF2283 domain-containing protein n=1 Tax=Synechococcus sp. BDU 130192 TaxID=2042059 RepID=UPI000C086F5D|nr:DUF2283 domain-containing protein [Synechococcus sp. BDU 130192]
MPVIRESFNYLKFVLLLQNLPKHSFFLLYDAEIDVLYIDFYNPPISSDDDELTDDDVVIRYGENDEVVELTVLHTGDK